ncbi:MAG: thiamine diphosphokinase [Clostridia bacterium]|nr:thiamine diphosphokinase [Clostridia bacterium]
MNVCYIFSAGDRTPADFQKDDSDMVIAADAGLLYARGSGFEPDVIIGDFDSLGYKPEGKSVITLPVRKDVTDTRYAVEYALKAGFKKIIIYGGLGGERLDHSLSNIADCAFAARNGADCRLIGARQTVAAVHNGKIKFPASCTGNISVFAFGGAAKGVTERGLSFEADNLTLSPDNASLGASNEFVGQEAEISVMDGTVVIVWSVESGVRS